MTDAAMSPADLAGDWFRPDRDNGLVSGLIPVTVRELFGNVRANLARGLPDLQGSRPHDQIMVYVGAGPSGVDTLPLLQLMARHPNAMVVTSGLTHRWLLEHGIRPSAYIACDPKRHMTGYLPPMVPGMGFFCASYVNPLLIDSILAARRQIGMFHVRLPGSIRDDGDDLTCADVNDFLEQERPDAPRHPGGVSSFLICAWLALILGFRGPRFQAFGVDSSYRRGSLYVDAKPVRMPVCQVQCDDGAVFDTNQVLATQAYEFLGVRDALADLGLDIVVHGDGLLPHLHRLYPRATMAQPTLLIEDEFGQRRELFTLDDADGLFDQAGEPDFTVIHD